MVKNLPTMQKTQVRSLSGKDPLEKGMATRSSILAWRIPWTEEPGRLQSLASQRVRHNWVTNTHTTNVQTFKTSQIQHTCPFILWIDYESISDFFTYYNDDIFCFSASLWLTFYFKFSCCFKKTYMQSTSWEMLGWRKHKLESKLPREISITSDMQMTPPLWQKVKKS